jgi:hypothetical protein
MTGGLFPDPSPTRAIGRTWRSRAAWLGLIVLLAGVAPAARSVTRINLAMNWFEELRAKVPSVEASG